MTLMIEVMLGPQFDRNLLFDAYLLKIVLKNDCIKANCKGSDLSICAVHCLPRFSLKCYDCDDFFKQAIK